jgi:hypothetical protein
MDRKRNGDGFTAGGTGLLARVAPLRRRRRTEAGSVRRLCEQPQQSPAFKPANSGIGRHELA